MLGYRLRNLLLSVIWCLVIGVSPLYALNLDRMKASFLNADYKAAIAEGERALATTGNSAGLDELYYILGLSYLKDGNLLRASDIFEIILKEYKESDFKDEAVIGLGDSYFLRGDYDQAQAYYEQAAKGSPNTKLRPVIYWRLSQVGFKKGDTQLAKEYSDKLKADFPASPEAKFSQDIHTFNGFYYTVQVGAFSNKMNADNLAQKLLAKNYPAYIEEAHSGQGMAYRVRVGKCALRQEAAELENRLSREGYPTKIFP